MGNKFTNENIFFLSPQSCPKESDTGYMLMEGASPPERIYEYDYTEPLQPNTLFRISHGHTEQVIVQVSIGDLSDATLSEHQLQQQQRQPIYWEYRTPGHLVFWKPWPAVELKSVTKHGSA